MWIGREEEEGEGEGEGEEGRVAIGCRVGKPEVTWLFELDRRDEGETGSDRELEAVAEFKAEFNVGLFRELTGATVGSKVRFF
ncbi:MAG: hypothetical protein Kow00121_05550 [Elainellaceae cyanobacterium]